MFAIHHGLRPFRKILTSDLQQLHQMGTPMPHNGAPNSTLGTQNDPAHAANQHPRFPGEPPLIQGVVQAWSNPQLLFTSCFGPMRMLSLGCFLTTSLQCMCDTESLETPVLLREDTSIILPECPCCPFSYGEASSHMYPRAEMADLRRVACQQGKPQACTSPPLGLLEWYRHPKSRSRGPA